MSTVEEIKRAIEQLPKEDFRTFRTGDPKARQPVGPADRGGHTLRADWISSRGALQEIVKQDSSFPE